MDIKIGQSVKIVTSDDITRYGNIHSEIYVNGESYFWVEYFTHSSKSVEIFPLKQLQLWNPALIKTKCTCGSDAVQGPGHTQYCDKTFKIIR